MLASAGGEGGRLREGESRREKGWGHRRCRARERRSEDAAQQRFAGAMHGGGEA